jgi:hypothetical protein
MNQSMIAVLFAQADRWREMGRDFRVDHTKLDPSLIVASLIVLVAVIAFLWFLHRLMNKREGRRLYNSPKKLFRSLCRLHELTRAERRTLVSLARSQQLQQPASLFLSPEQFVAAIASPAWQSQRRQVERVRTKLFAKMEELGQTDATKPADA